MFSYIFRSLTVFIFCFSLITSSFGRSGDSFERDYLTLKKIPADYRSFGAVCEQVARLRLKESYDPKKFKFLIGLEYRNSRRVLGEVDLIVFSKKDNKVAIVGEVKCWKDLQAAFKKAKKQLNRFFKAIEGNEKITFHPKEPIGIKFEKNLFLGTKKMYFSQKVEEQNPFENNIGLTLPQLKNLRKKLQTCQRDQKCPTLK